ncbi:MAG TPA: selenium metabolism-associated LysR family transcriptional regulator [Bacillota bacterium]|nr:selenium metabolism-associated LysR family transcriptional regulator [Bacillota bacterium]
MDIRQLAIFVSIANHGTFTAAGKALYISQPTVSVQMAALEKELGVALFERQSRGIALTPAGKILKRYAEDILMLKDQAVAAMGRYKHDVSGRLRVIASTVPADYILPGVVSRFLHAYPGVFVELSRADSATVWDAIRNYEAELGVAGSAREDSSLDHLAVARDELVLIAPFTEEYSHWEDPVPLESVLRAPMLCREPGSGTQKTFDDALRLLGVDPERISVRAQLDSVEAIKSAVAEGGGVAVVSSLAMQGDTTAQSIRILHIEGLSLVRCFYLITHAKRVLSPAAQAFRDFVVSSLTC